MRRVLFAISVPIGSLGGCDGSLLGGLFRLLDHRDRLTTTVDAALRASAVRADHTVALIMPAGRYSPLPIHIGSGASANAWASRK